MTLSTDFTDVLNQIIALSPLLDAERAKWLLPDGRFNLEAFSAADLPATSPTERELMGLIKRLSEDERAQLEALFCLGRGDFDDFDTAKAHFVSQDPSNAGGYLRSKLELGEMLRQGVIRLNEQIA